MKTTLPDIRLFFSSRCWIESRATDQLRHAASLPGMRFAVGLPDLHPGKGAPIGSAFLNADRLYPHLVGNDVGCGMLLAATALPVRKLKLDKLEKQLSGLEESWTGDTTAWLAERGLASSPSDLALGTIGGGNHFAEVQAVAEVRDPDAFARLGLDAEAVHLLLHSGSRSYGDLLCRDFTSRLGAEGIAAESPEGRDYLARHDYGVAWAKANRALLAHRLAQALATEERVVSDLAHNGVEAVEVDGGRGWLHRKGATPSDRGVAVIPGSRGTLSYLVEPAGPQERNAFSLAHGAGRKWTRSDARARLRDRYRATDLTRTKLGGRVICEDRNLLFEEAPDAYKSIESVIEELLGAGLIRVIATLKPLLTYKTRRESDAYGREE